LGGYSDAPSSETEEWSKLRLQDLKFIEVRGRIKLSEDASDPDADASEVAEEEE
jgi:hypothetical protein